MKINISGFPLLYKKDEEEKEHKEIPMLRFICYGTDEHPTRDHEFLLFDRDQEKEPNRTM